MFYYTYRFFFAALASVMLQCVGYFYLLESPLEEMLMLRKQEQVLIRTIQAIAIAKKNNHDNEKSKTSGSIAKLSLPVSKSKFDLIADVVKLFKQHQLNINAINLMPNKILSSDFIELSVVAQGKFQHFISFLLKQENQLNAMQLLDFAIQPINLNANQLKLRMIFLIATSTISTLFLEEKSHAAFNKDQLFCPPEGFHI